MTSPRIIAMFAYRYEPDWLVDQLRENLSWCDGFAELDDRGCDQMWSVDAERVAELKRRAVAMGADWILYCSPDERFEDGTGDTLRRLAEHGRYDRYRFHLREMWTPDSYRVDGVWGTKRRTRFYRPGSEGTAKMLDLNIYHLKMIEPENRIERVRVHKLCNTWDNKGRGFDYLTDETGMELERIPDGRGYSPAYRRFDWRVEE